MQRLAMAHLAKDEPELAVRKALEAKALFRGTEDRSSEAALLHMLAQLSLEKGVKGANELSGKPFDAKFKQHRKNVRQDGREASKRARQALGLSTMADDKFMEGVSLIFLAQARLLNGRFSEALKAATKAELLFAEYGDKVQEARAAVIVAQAHSFDESDKEKVMEFANKALEKARAANDWQAEDAAIRILEAIIEKEQKALPPVEAVAAAPGTEIQVAGEAGSVAVEPKGLDPEAVRPRVFDTVKNVTGAEDEIFMDTPLMDTGMDSLSAVAFRNELNRAFTGVNMPASLMFDYPSINQIVDFVVESSKA